VMGHRDVGGLLRGDGWVRPHGRWSAYTQQCSLACQVGSCRFAVGLGSEVTSLGRRRCRRRLAGSGVACGGSPSCLLVGAGRGIIGVGGGGNSQQLSERLGKKLLVWI